jgi:hypothetical protein
MHLARPAWLVFPGLLVGLLGVACATLLAQDSPESPKDTGSHRHVDAEVCQSCHEGQYKTFAASAHVQTLKSKKGEMQGCEGCHGPGAAHVDAGGDPEKFSVSQGRHPKRFRNVSPAGPALTLLLLLMVALPAFSRNDTKDGAAAGAVAEAAQYAGSDACKTCHEDLYTKNFRDHSTLQNNPEKWSWLRVMPWARGRARRGWGRRQQDRSLQESVPARGECPLPELSWGEPQPNAFQPVGACR